MKESLGRRVLVAGAAGVLVGLGLLASPLHLIGAMLIVLGAVIVGLAGPDFGLLAILVLFPIHPLAARIAGTDLGVSGSALLIFSSWKEAALAAVLAGQMVRLVAEQPKWRDFRPHFVDVIAAALGLLVGLGIALHPGGLALNEARLLLFPIGVYIAIRMSHITVRRFFEAAAVTALAVASFLIVQTSFLGWAFVSRYWGNAQTPIPFTYTAHALIGPRGAGTLASPNEAALILAVWACMLASALLVLRERRRWHALVLAVVLVALAVTFSRSGIVGAVAGLTILTAAAVLSMGFRPRQGLALLVVAALAAGAVSASIYAERGGVELLRGTVASLSAAADSEEPASTGASTSPYLDNSTVDHLASLSDAWAVIRTHPLGVGLGTVGARSVPITGERPHYIIESWYFSMGVSMGWLGFAWAILLPIALLACALVSIRRRHALAGYALLGTALTVAFVGFLLPTMMEPQIAMIPWALAGFAVGARSMAADASANGLVGARAEL
jgi:hypothetical protein